MIKENLQLKFFQEINSFIKIRSAGALFIVAKPAIGSSLQTPLASMVIIKRN
jgi:hypothetical protein